MERTRGTFEGGKRAIVTDETEIRPRVTLSTGTVLAFRRMENGATACDPTNGGAMTEAESDEYLQKSGLPNTRRRK